MKNIVFLCGCAMLCSLGRPSLLNGAKKMVINVSVADLRTSPEPVPTGLCGPAMSKDIGAQDSQVLYSECVLCEDVADNPDWIKVSALGQKAWRNNGWVGYPGYILKSCLTPISEFPKYNIVLQNLWTPLFSKMDLSGGVIKNLAIGTRLEAKRIDDQWWNVVIDSTVTGYIRHSSGIYELLSAVCEIEEDLRGKIVNIAHLFVQNKAPYVWGGRSPLNPDFKNQITGIDCSGLTNLCYQACGLEIPRDSGPQLRAANRLNSGRDLKPADLIFFANDEQGLRISHVVIFVGDDFVIESTGLGFSSIKELDNKDLNVNGFNASDLGVRKISVKDLIGVDVAEIESGKTLAKNGKRIFLGSYFGPEDKIQKMRDIALGKDVAW